MSIARLPCPFCGGRKFGMSDGGRGVRVHCDNRDCYAGGPAWANSAAEAIKAWNKRDGIEQVPPAPYVREYL